MASTLPNGHAPSGGDLPSTQLPDHVDGFIDVEILTNIHKYLHASQMSDDVALAAWVKENYLQEPLEDISRPIHNAEGFVNLDKAYRRVRQLTGKAQDKWPFFHRNWKKMSSTLIKHAILGNAPVGLTRPGINGEIRDIPTSNGFDGQHGRIHISHTPCISSQPVDNLSQTPKLQVSRGTGYRDEQHMQELKSPLLTDSPLAHWQEQEQKAHRQGRWLTTTAPGSSPAMKASSASELTAWNENAGTPSFDGTTNGTTPPVDDVREAGAGKVRGPHGRFVNKGKPSPVEKKGPKIKWVKKSRTRAALEGESEEDASSSDAGIQANTPVYDLASRPSSEREEEAIQGSSAPPTDVQSTDATLNAPPMSAILAAEADAVPSNLDRLPPGFVGKKRKSDSNIQQGVLKRARGSRGGVLGRPRKSETLIERSQPEAEDSVDDKQTPSQPETPAQNPTRRSSRKSAASAIESSTPWDPAEDVLLSRAAQKHPASNDTNTTLNGGLLSNRKQVATEISPSVDQSTKEANNESVNGASASTASSQVRKAQKTPTLSKRKKRVSFSPEMQADNVEFFARISTSAGTQEVPLSEEDLTSEVGLVKRYAAWQNAGNANVTFEVFKNIVKFAR